MSVSVVSVTGVRVEVAIPVLSRHFQVSKEFNLEDFLCTAKASDEALLCFHSEFPDRAYQVVIHGFLSSADLSRVDCSLNESQRQRFQRLMRGMDWSKFIRNNENWSLKSIDWMRDRGVLLPDGLEDKLEGRGFNPDFDCGDGTGLDFFSDWTCCEDFSLLEQFLVSDMHEAAFIMLKAGWPRDIEQPLSHFSYAPSARTPIMFWACIHGYLDFIKFLVNERNASVYVYDGGVCTGGMCYCLPAVCYDIPPGNEILDSKRVEILRFLIDEAGADITTRINIIGPTHQSESQSLLDVAGYHGRLGVVKYIHEEKKDILKLEESRVANHAARRFHLDLLVYLIEKRNIPVREIMNAYYEGVKETKIAERFCEQDEIQLQQKVATRRNNVKTYLKGLIGAEYDSDKE